MKFRVLFAILFAVTLTASSYAAESPEGFLRGLYKMHIDQMSQKDYWMHNKKELAKYFDKDLTALFLKDVACGERTHEICNLDFDPILYAQDFDERLPFQLKISKISHKSRVRYQVTYTNIGTISMIYDLIETPVGWRITDIIYSKGSTLKKILSAK